MRKAVYQAVGIVISAAAVPIAGIRARVRAELDLAEGIGRAREGVAMRVRAHERIDEREQGEKQGQDGCHYLSSHLLIDSALTLNQLFELFSNRRYSE